MTSLLSESRGRSQPHRQRPERRQHRRHDLQQQTISVRRCGTQSQEGEELGQVVDLSCGGLRIRTGPCGLRPDQQVRIRLELPTYAGISPFVDTSGPSLRPRSDWVGWMAVSRVEQLDENQCEVAGRLMDMDELDRGMLGLYLSTQPLAE